VAQLGFTGRNDLLLLAKTGILVASLLAGIMGFIWLYLVSKPIVPLR
jgi:NhaA family Na+:H+ antiporter